MNAALNPEDPGNGEMAGGYSPSNIPISDQSLITARLIAEVRADLRDEFREALRSQQELLVTTGVSRHEKAMLRIDAVERAANVFEENLNRVRALNRLAQGRGQTLAQMAIAWVLRDSRVTSALIGARNVQQLDNSLDAIERPQFSDEELREIDKYAQEGSIDLWKEARESVS